jgi:hypothetical protein
LMTIHWSSSLVIWTMASAGALTNSGSKLGELTELNDQHILVIWLDELTELTERVGTRRYLPPAPGSVQVRVRVRVHSLSGISGRYPHPPQLPRCGLPSLLKVFVIITSFLVWFMSNSHYDLWESLHLLAHILYSSSVYQILLLRNRSTQPMESTLMLY